MCIGSQALSEVILPDSLTKIRGYAFSRTGLTQISFPPSFKEAGRGCFEGTPVQKVTIRGDASQVRFRSMGIQTDGLVVCADHLPLRSISTSMRRCVLREFIRRFLNPGTRDEIPAQVRTDRLEYIRKHRKSLWKDAEFRRLILQEGFLKAGDFQSFWDVAEAENDLELKAELLEYRKARLTEEAVQQAAEKRRERNVQALVRPEPYVAELRQIWRCSKWNRETQVLTSWRGESTEVTVPASLGRQLIRVIGESAFDTQAQRETDEVRKNRGKIRKITVSEGIQRIKERAFFGCGSLKEVVLPESLLLMEAYAFSECGNLEEITIPAGILRLDLTAFYHCDALRVVKILGTDTDLVCSLGKWKPAFRISAPAESRAAHWASRNRFGFTPLEKAEN